MRKGSAVGAVRLREAVDAARLRGQGIAAIAREAGLDTTRIYRILDGSMSLTFATAAKLAGPLGVSPTFLLGIEEVEVRRPTVELSDEQRDWLTWWRSLPAEVREELFALGELMRSVPAARRQEVLLHRDRSHPRPSKRSGDAAPTLFPEHS